MKKLLIALPLILLAACAQQTVAPMVVDQQQHQKQLAELHHWLLEGKIAVRHADQSDSATVRWQQDDERFDVFLSGPLGAGATRLIGTPHTLMIANHNGQHATNDDPQALLEQQLGWYLPIEQLPHWIIGESNHAPAAYHANHTLKQIDQHDWHITYPSYQTVGDQVLPEKILLEHEDLRVTIVIKRWEIH